MFGKTAARPLHPLYLYPEMLDELVKYVFIPQKLVAGYRQHLVEIKSGAKTRP